MEFSWIQRHALLILIRKRTARAIELCPPDVAANLFSYYLDRLVAGGYVEKVARGEYGLTTKGQKVAGTFSTSTERQTENLKTVVMLYARSDEGYMLFQWSRQPYLGKMTPLYDRVPFGKSLDDGIKSACLDKLGKVVPTRYQASALIRIVNDGELISHMHAVIYEVDVNDIDLPFESRNGMAFVASNHEALMDGVVPFLDVVRRDDVGMIETTWSY